MTHDQEEALTMSDRIAVMNQGRIEQLGTPEYLYERPATRFVADFIGTTNLLRGESSDRGRRRGRPPRDRRALPGRPGRGPVGTTIDISLRPEAIRICGPDSSVATSPTLDGVTSGWAVPATIEQVAYLGAAVRYLVRSQGGFAMTILAPTSGTGSRSGISVALSWSPDEALVLVDQPAGVEEES